jgi:hypothetical protein
MSIRAASTWSLGPYPGPPAASRRVYTPQAVREESA